MRNTVRFIAGLLFLVALGMQSCVSLRDEAGMQSKANTEQQHRRVKKITAKKFLAGFEQIYPSYKNLYVKFKMKYIQDGDSKSLKGIIQNVRDSIIILSLYHVSGVPVAKIKLTKDSLFLDDRLNKKFYKADYGLLYEKYALNLNYSNIEALLFARPFIYGDSVVTEKKLKDFKRYKDTADVVFQSAKNKVIKKFYKKTKKGKRLSHKLVASSTIQQIFVNRETLRLDRITVKDLINAYELIVEYNDYSNTLNNKNFIKLMGITVKNKSGEVKMNIKYYKVKEKPGMRLKFTIPKYEDE